jgi:hypothetical protein
MTSSSLRLSRPNHDNPAIANEHSPASFYECLLRGKEWTLNRAILMLTQGPLLARSCPPSMLIAFLKAVAEIL